MWKSDPRDLESEAGFQYLAEKRKLVAWDRKKVLEEKKEKKKKSFPLFPFLNSLTNIIMSGMELTTSYPPSKFESDNDLSNDAVVAKYKHAADIVNCKSSDLTLYASYDLTLVSPLKLDSYPPWSHQQSLSWCFHLRFMSIRWRSHWSHGRIENKRDCRKAFVDWLFFTVGLTRIQECWTWYCFPHLYLCQQPYSTCFSSFG